MSRKLASIQRIKAINPIEGADAIEVATVLGWKVVVKKGEFKSGDLCVYCEIDSVLPEKPEFEFLRPRKFRIKTTKLRGQISQGICFPTNILLDCERWELIERSVEGMDVTEILGVTKYEPPIPACLGGQIKGPFPGFLHKTDETRVQADPRLLEEFTGKKVYITEKIDGTSATFSYHNGEFDICSRNLSLKDTDNNTFWKIFRKYNLESILTKHPNGIAIQGEIAGPGIQKNPLNLDEHQLFVFNCYHIDAGKFANFDFLKYGFCAMNNLQMVPVIEEDVIFDWNLEELLEMAKGGYWSGKPREGIVIRPMEETHSEVLGGRLSMKVINNDFLLKGGN